MDHLTELADFAARFDARDLPRDVAGRTATILADTLGAMAGGAAETEVVELAARLATGGPVPVVGTGRRAAPGQAALLNGISATALEMDEGNQFCKGHPGAHTIPAALAFAVGTGVSGRDLLTAIALGYEIGARVGIATRLRPAMHPHGSWGAICAAVAVARLAGRDAVGMRTAMNMAASYCLATSRRTMLEGGTLRNSFAGVSGQLGQLTHDLLEAGFSADADGVGQVFGRIVSDEFDRDALTEGLGTRWEVGRNYFKMHACCRYNHAALDALMQILVRAGPLAPEAVSAVEVETYSLAVELDDPRPRNALAGRFSVPYAIATTLVHGASDIRSFTADRLDDPRTLALAAKVRLTEDPAMTAALPDRRPARVRLTLQDGRVLEAATETNRGDWADPYPASELREKFLSLAARSWAPEPAAQVWETANGLDGAQGDALFAALAAAEETVPAVRALG